jgi:signal transduction histidine kinase
MRTRGNPEIAMPRRARRPGAAPVVDAIIGGRLDEPPRDSFWPLVAHYELALAEHERQRDRLRVENQQAAQALVRAEAMRLAAQKALASQALFLEVIAHELRGPLAAVGNAAAALATLSPDDAQRARIRAIVERQTEHASRLIEDLLDLSRARTGKLRLALRAVDLRGVIETAVDMCKPAMDRRGQRFAAEVPPSALHVLGDPVRLVQILGNLLENASKYTPEGGAIALVAAVEGDCLVLSVSDSGVGMTADASLAVFDAFAQQAHAIAFDGAGLGIGLAVVRELVRAQGGTVTARSAGLGEGSQFVVRLPLAGDAAIRAAAVAAASAGPVRPG